MNKVRLFFYKIFRNYCWLGLVFVMLAIFIDTDFNYEVWIKDVGTELCMTLGISIIVGTFFSWASTTSEFMDKIQRLLKSVVIDKDFLAGLDTQSKKNVLCSIIKPTPYEKEIYTNIDEYYNHYIQKTLDLSIKNIRTDYNIFSIIQLDQVNNVIKCRKRISYTLYPTKLGFENIKIGFSDASINGKILSLKVWAQDGTLLISESDIALNEEMLNGEIMFVATFDIKPYNPPINKHLKIRFETEEEGGDPWYTSAIQILQPTYGIVYNVRCESGISIKSFDIFSYGAQIDVEKKNNTELIITANQWIPEGTGISITTAKNSIPSFRQD